ncbi:MAG: hypothetical protein GX963_03965 [Bacteroidales bacterium]|nr:hypothetical protein [Bacteroidales bacterium]
MKRVVIANQYKKNLQLVTFLNNLPHLFHNEGEILHDDRNIIKEFCITEEKLIVKSFKRPIPIQRFIYSFFRKTKAHRAYLNARKIRKRGIDTPREIAFVEVWHKGLFDEGYLVTDVTYDLPIADLLVNNDGGFCKALAEQFASFVVELHMKGILHHDLNSTNVLYRKSETGNYHFSLIDINRMKVYAKGTLPPKDECLKNLNRFTWDYELFEFVLTAYAKIRNWDVQETLDRALKLKKHFDAKRHRTKSFLNFFRNKD